MKLLRVQNLQIKYGHDESNELLICDYLSFECKEGQIIGVFGPNGSGKTSLLKALLGLKKPSSGKIEFIDNDSSKIIAPSLSYIPQQIENSFFSWLGVAGNINYVAKGKSSSKKLKELWKAFGISFGFDTNPLDCSGGMLQQAAIVRAFINDPHIIIGDEPFSALDVSTAGRIRSVFREKIKESGAIAIIALHNLDDLAAVCDKVIFIPNKPYSSVEKGLFHPIKIYSNPHLSGQQLMDKESSMKSTIERLFDL